MKLNPTYLSSRRISKSTLKSFKIIFTNDNSDWVNMLEVKKPLLSPETTMFQQLSQSIDLLKRAKALGKLTANLTLATNLVSFIARIQIPVKFTNGRLSFFSILFFIFIFMLFYFSIFLFLEQLGLRLIGHAVTSVTT